MKHTYILSTATALVLGLSGIAWAGAPVEAPCNVNGNANWSHDKLHQMIINRHSNAGNGNGAEASNFRYNHQCDVAPDSPESIEWDLDPGNSGAHNANNRKNK